MIVWLNEGLIPAEQATLSIYDRGFLLGDGVFETILVQQGQPQYFEAHCQRLAQTAQTLRIPLVLPVVETAVPQLIAANHLHKDTASVRITLTRGPQQQRGLATTPWPQPTLLITAETYTPPTQAVRLGLSSFHRPQTQPYASIKHLNYLPSLLALTEVKQRGFDDAVLLNDSGHVVSSTCANIFCLHNGQLLTPPLNAGALPGITRARIIAWAEQTGFPCQDHPLLPDALLEAETVFLTNSLVGVLPAASFEEKLYATTHPVIEKVKEWLSEGY